MIPDTFTKNAGLRVEEPLLFEKNADDISGTGVDLPPCAQPVDKGLEGLCRSAPPPIPGFSEPEVVRHYTRLSQKNYGIDTGLFPLGSCTMKHNPRINEKLARLPGFSQAHPLQPDETVQGILEVMWELTTWLKQLTGMAGVCLTPAAGAHGELCGLFLIKAALQARGESDQRRVMLIPDSAHGTNPATAAQCGFDLQPIPSDKRGLLDLEALAAAVGPTTAGLMLTNPNTCGLFERDTLDIAKILHDNGAYYYCDGANFNALLGQARPADLGVDVMHINLHKTFSTPHGGGGPGSGPVVMTKELAPFAPLPWVVKEVDEGGHAVFRLVEDAPHTVGRMKAFHGQVGMMIRALAYMMSLGGDGLYQASADAVLNARYVGKKLATLLHQSFPEPCMHEVLFDDRTLAKYGLGTVDLAKILQDEGFYPMTTYFPLVVHGAMLIEPTETESKETLDQFVTTVEGWMHRAATPEGQDRFKAAPIYTPRRRFDEASTARKPKLRWTCEKG